jgi:hypothetical protein
VTNRIYRVRIGAERRHLNESLDWRETMEEDVLSQPSQGLTNALVAGLPNAAGVHFLSTHALRPNTVMSMSFRLASTTSGASGSMRAISLISEPSEDSTDVIPISM